MCQNIYMARGWESKDVESQVDLLEAKQEKSTSAAKSAEQLRRDQERKDLQLSRVRIVNDLSPPPIRNIANPSKPLSPTSTRKSAKLNNEVS